MKCSTKLKDNPKEKPRHKKEKEHNHSLLIGQKGQGKQNTKFKTKKGQKGKGYTAEEASVLESDAQDQWLESSETSVLHDTWQTDSPSWDWYLENDWEEADAKYQDWETSQDFNL